MKVKINVDNIFSHNERMLVKGEIINLGEKPTRFWKRRIEDSKIDNCLEVLPESKEIETKKEKSGKK